MSDSPNLASDQEDEQKSENREENWAAFDDNHYYQADVSKKNSAAADNNENINNDDDENFTKNVDDDDDEFDDEWNDFEFASAPQQQTFVEETKPPLLFEKSESINIVEDIQHRTTATTSLETSSSNNLSVVSFFSVLLSF